MQRRHELPLKPVFVWALTTTSLQHKPIKIYLRIDCRVLWTQFSVRLSTSGKNFKLKIVSTDRGLNLSRNSPDKTAHKRYKPKKGRKSTTSMFNTKAKRQERKIAYILHKTYLKLLFENFFFSLLFPFLASLSYSGYFYDACIRIIHASFHIGGLRWIWMCTKMARRSKPGWRT